MILQSSWRRRVATMRISAEQTAELQQAFNEFDKDGSGFISTRELGWAMRALGRNPTEKEILELINKVWGGKVEVFFFFIFSV